MCGQRASKASYRDVFLKRQNPRVAWTPWFLRVALELFFSKENLTSKWIPKFLFHGSWFTKATSHKPLTAVWLGHEIWPGAGSVLLHQVTPCSLPREISRPVVWDLLCRVWRLRSTWLNVSKFSRLSCWAPSRERLKLNKLLPFAVWSHWFILFCKYYRVKEYWISSLSVIPRKTHWAEIERLLNNEGNLTWVITDVRFSVKTQETPQAAERERETG